MLSKWALESVLSLYLTCMNTGEGKLENLSVVFCSHLASPALLAICSSSAYAPNSQLGFRCGPAPAFWHQTLFSLLFLDFASGSLQHSVPGCPILVPWNPNAHMDRSCLGEWDTLYQPSPHTHTNNLVWFCRLHTCLVHLLRCGSRFGDLCLS